MEYLEVLNGVVELWNCMYFFFIFFCKVGKLLFLGNYVLKKILWFFFFVNCLWVYIYIVKEIILL